MRVLRFPIKLHKDESIPGALARGIYDNVLECSSIFFADTGLRQRKVGQLIALNGNEAKELARYLTCDVDKIISRSAVIRKNSVRSTFIEFNNLSLSKSDLILARRRISPTTLLTRPYHHEDWLSALLPYCPHSLERLVEKCVYCGVNLTWSHCWGIGICEWCQEIIPPPKTTGLPKDYIDNYRFFADLISPRQERRQSAVGSLTDDFRSMPVGSIVTAALRFGQICRAEPIIGMRRASFAQIETEFHANIINTGTAIIRGWPSSIIDWANESFEKKRTDLAGYHQFRSQIKRLGNSWLEDKYQVALVRSALPNEFRDFVYSGSNEDEITPTRFAKITHIHSRKFQKIRHALEVRRLPGNIRVRSHLDLNKVTNFFELYQRSVLFTRLTYRFGLPFYAIEQFACLGILEYVEDEPVVIARGGPCVTACSVDSFICRIEKMALRSEPPRGCISLYSASRQIGGREKPWADIILALESGKIHFWKRGLDFNTKTIFVWPNELNCLHSVSFDPLKFPAFTFASKCNQTDSAELLNMSSQSLTAFVISKHITFKGNQRLLLASKNDVLKLASEMISPVEAAFALGSGHRSTINTIEAMGLKSIGCGWSRAEFLNKL